MSYHRIQKLLFSEYCDFEDMVLIESPFAQTTKEGLGLRQIHLGLTPTKLILAVDILPPAEDSEVYCSAETDPEIETFELIAVYPVECVNVSIYRRKKRQTLKAHFCNNRILYFELGGFEKRRAFWNLWCERVQFLCPEEPGSSKSETSVATSTSNSSLHLISKRNVMQNGKQQVWCKFDLTANNEHVYKWVDKYLYIGTESKEINPIPKYKTHDNNQFINSPGGKGGNVIIKEPLETVTAEHNLTESKILKVNRFASGVQEGCSTGLFLPAEECELNNRFHADSTESVDVFTLGPTILPKLAEISESALKIWESSLNDTSACSRHPRRYGINPQPHFLYGLGSCNIYGRENISTQMKKCMSASKIRNPPADHELKLSVSKRILTASMSCEAFHLDTNLNIHSCVSKMPVPDKSNLLFWTPEYWRQPKPAYNNYLEFLEYLNNIKDLKKKHQNKSYKMGNKIPFCKKTNKNKDNKFVEKRNNKTLEINIRQALKMEVALTAWDFDSTNLAYQLTTIDKELFLKIHPLELQVVMWQRSSKNAPNINSFITFSRRISCLITTEVLREGSEKARAKLIVKFLNIANRCDRIASYHSCKSILNGLQSPPIYRLHNTWAYLRQHHALKYQLFKQLCYKYSDPRSIIYQKYFYKASQSPPYLPYIGDILARLLNKVHHMQENPDSAPDDKENYDSNTILYNNLKDNTSLDDIISNTDVQFQNRTQITPSTTLSKLISTLKLWSGQSQNKTYSEQTVFEKGINEKLENNKQVAKSLQCDDLYIDNRRKRLKEVTHFLEVSQNAATKYVFDINNLAREYLLKARYREDTENFFHSLKIE